MHEGTRHGSAGHVLCYNFLQRKAPRNRIVKSEDQAERARLGSVKQYVVE
jgi:hypothetical protein